MVEKEPEFITNEQLCKKFGHHWRATSQHGIFVCSNCKVTGFCSRCLLIYPRGLVPMCCEQHYPKLRGER